MYENVYVEKDDKFIVGFINSHGELEYTEYKAYDCGTFEIDESKKYTKEELENV